MNILFLAAYPPVLHVHGGGVRMFHNIRLLSKAHTVHVLSFVENDEERRLLKSVEPICESVTAIQRVSDFTAHWLSLKPFLVFEFATPAMHEAVDAAVRNKKIDIIQCEYLQMAQFRRPGTFSILTAHEALSANGYRAFQDAADPVAKLRTFSRWMATLNYEVSMCNAFHRVITMTKSDADYLRSYAHRADIRDIPIGIDPEYFRPSAEEPARPIEILFIGNFRHTPNVEAAAFLLHEVAPYFPKYRFIIAGSHFPDSFQKAANVDFPGYISETRMLFHSSNTIFAAPLFSGTGQRVKLLEAFAMGCPVITTSLGAAGFPIISGEQAMIAETPEAFRSALTALTYSVELRRRLGAAARRMVVDDFSWEGVGRQFLNLIEEAKVS
jgi:glycosyltransferase involved in cell wall biosynthesis